MKPDHRSSCPQRAARAALPSRWQRRTRRIRQAPLPRRRWPEAETRVPSCRRAMRCRVRKTRPLALGAGRRGGKRACFRAEDAHSHVARTFACGTVMDRECDFDRSRAGADDDDIESSRRAPPTRRDAGPTGDERLDRSNRQRVRIGAGQARRLWLGAGVDGKQIEANAASVGAGGFVPRQVETHQRRLVKCDACSCREVGQGDSRSRRRHSCRRSSPATYPNRSAADKAKAASPPSRSDAPHVGVRAGSVARGRRRPAAAAGAQRPSARWRRRSTSAGRSTSQSVSPSSQATPKRRSRSRVCAITRSLPQSMRSKTSGVSLRRPTRT